MNIELPKDAEGREIPLDTKVLYDKNGSRREVDWFKFYPDKDRWDIVFKDSYSHFSPQNLSITPPDSWKNLLDDLDRGADAFDYETCAYFRNSRYDCSSCIANESRSCEQVLMRDIASRIRNLRGED